MAGVTKKRGRPPKSVAEKPKFQYHLMKKPKYLLKKPSTSQRTTPTVSRASSPQDSEENRSLRSISKHKVSRHGRKSSGKPAAKKGMCKPLLLIFLFTKAVP